jgi:hypothetical protein
MPIAILASGRVRLSLLTRHPARHHPASKPEHQSLIGHNIMVHLHTVFKPCTIDLKGLFNFRSEIGMQERS